MPFGYWRAYASRYSRRLEWAAAVHLPVPLIILFRSLAGIGLSVESLPLIAVYVAAFFTGQRLGGLAYRRVVESTGVDTRCFFTGLRSVFADRSRPSGV